MIRRSIVAGVLVVCVIGGCDKGSSSAGGSGTDLSTPKAAARTFAEAMKRGDAGAAKSATTGVDPQVIDSMVAATASQKRLEDAAVAKWGDAGKGLAGSARVPQHDYATALDNADVKVEGDTATITPKEQPGSPVTLKKIGGDWKVDFAAMAGMKDMGSLLPMMNAMAKANDEVASEVKAGKYQTVAEARKAHSQKLMSAVMPGLQGLQPPKILPGTSGEPK